MKKIEKFKALLTRKRELGRNLENISKILEFGNSEEKIKMLETLDNENNPKMLKKNYFKIR